MIFTIVTEQILNEPIPQFIIDKLGYTGNPILKDKVLICSELENGTFAISVNLKAEGMECAWTDLSSEEIELAKLLYGEENLSTIEEYKNLNFKSIDI